MYNRKDVEFVPFTEMTPEIYAKVKVGVKFEDLYKLGLRDEIEFVAGTESMPDMWYKFNEKTGEFDAYTHYEALIRWGLGLNMPAEAPEVVVPGTPVTTLEELVAAISAGGEYKLEAPMELDSTLLMDKEEVETLINLNNQRVVAPINAPEGGDSDSTAFQVDAGHLVLQGDGEVVAQEATYSNAVYARGGQVDILGGIYSNAGDNCDLIYAAGTAQINIYGGEFRATKNSGASGTGNEYTALNIKDKDRETAKITVYGGKFYGFDPANNVSEGANTNFVAEGYESIESEEDGMKVYTVQKIAE